MMKCVCGHSEQEHVAFAKLTPCAHATCSCEDFDFGGCLDPQDVGAIPVMTIDVGCDVLTMPVDLTAYGKFAQSVTSDNEICPPHGRCGECLLSECPNMRKDNK
jgi:hypothetical protein